ncbi:MAG: ribonuclease Z [Saprospiraceae bacterium]|nr:ribonuclease Z [Saprospiraceae bacterium]
MQLTILGNGSGGPFQGRHYTAQVLQVENRLFLIDCGEGTQMQMYRFQVRYDRLEQIFVSHLHGDHVFGLVGLLTSWCLKKRTNPLHIYSPPGMEELVETNLRLCGVRVPVTYPIHFHVVEATAFDRVFDDTLLEVFSVPLSHRGVACCGWLFREKIRPRNLRPEKITEYDIPYSLLPGIKAGQDLVLPGGQIVPNDELTLPPRAPLSYAFCSDTAPSDQVAEWVKGVDFLYHEATFLSEHTAEADLSGHSTAAQAAEIARKAGAKRLLLGHFSGRYADTAAHLAEARAIFPNTEAAEEGKTYEIAAAG